MSLGLCCVLWGKLRGLLFLTIYKLIVEKNYIHLACKETGCVPPGTSLTASVRTFVLSPLDKYIS